MAVFLQSLSFLALLVGVAMGLFAAVTPRRAAAMLGFGIEKPHAISEVRASLGAFTLALHLPALIAAWFAMMDRFAGPQEPPITAILSVVLALPAALGWLFIAGARVVSIYADKVSTKHNWLSVGFEVLMAVAILAPLIFSLRL